MYLPYCNARLPIVQVNLSLLCLLTLLCVPGLLCLCSQPSYSVTTYVYSVMLTYSQLCLPIALCVPIGYLVFFVAYSSMPT